MFGFIKDIGGAIGSFLVSLGMILTGNSVAPEDVVTEPVVEDVGIINQDEYTESVVEEVGEIETSIQQTPDTPRSVAPLETPPSSSVAPDQTSTAPVFKASCVPYVSASEVGKTIKMTITIEGVDSNFIIDWNKSASFVRASDEGKYGYFVFKTTGRQNESAIITRKSDGKQQQLTCSVFIEESRESADSEPEEVSVDQYQQKLIELEKKIIERERKYLADVKRISEGVGQSATLQNAQLSELERQYEMDIADLELQKRELYLEYAY